MSASSRRLAGSRLDDGSSSTRICGRMASTVATATRRRWPNHRWWGARSRSPPCRPRERLVDPLVEVVAAQAEVGRAERHVVADRRHEQLVVGVLEDDADAAADLRQVPALVDRQPADGAPIPAWGRRMPLRCSTRVVLPAPFGPSRPPARPRHVEVHAEQGLRAVRIGERDPVTSRAGRSRRSLIRHLRTAMTAMAAATPPGTARRTTPRRGVARPPSSGIVPV